MKTKKGPVLSPQLSVIPTEGAFDFWTFYESVRSNRLQLMMTYTPDCPPMNPHPQAEAILTRSMQQVAKGEAETMDEALRVCLEIWLSKEPEAGTQPLVDTTHSNEGI